MGVWPIASESERGNGAEGFGYVCDRVMLLIVDLRLRVGGSVFFFFWILSRMLCKIERARLSDPLT